MLPKPPQCPPHLDTSPKQPPPPPPPPPEIPPKLLKILEKYKYNWRLTQLSIQRPYKRAKKFVKVEEPIGFYESIVREGTQDGHIPERTQDVATTPLWRLEVQKKMFTKNVSPKVNKKLRMRFYDAMDKNMDLTWNSVYYYYRKAKKKKDELAIPPKDRDAKPRIQKEKLLKAIEHCHTLATPKKVFLPPPIEKNIVRDWRRTLAYMDLLSEPRSKKRKYKRPSIDSQYVDPSKVKPAALKYKLSQWMFGLASRIPEHFIKKEKPKIPGTVKRSALTAKITPRIEEMAVPRKRADAPDMDVKENAFTVSKNALKYKITERIEELAKPRER